MFSIEELVIIRDAFLDIRAGNIQSDGAGICNNLVVALRDVPAFKMFIQVEVELMGLLRHLWADWEFKADKHFYPIPSIHKDMNPESCYLNYKHKWGGRLYMYRLSLLNHLIKKLNQKITRLDNKRKGYMR